MDESETASIELSRGEARTVISALSEHEYRADRAEEEGIIALRERFEEAFGFGNGDDSPNPTGRRGEGM